ncbi:MAG: hypothetical protein ACREQY_12645, partial [Candidatus Binatia bacterium]
MAAFVAGALIGATFVATPARCDDTELEAGAAVTGFFSFAEAVPEPLAEALRAYEEGRFFDALAASRAIGAGDRDLAEDDAKLVAALALRALGWDELALPLLVAVLESRPPGPYHPPALAELVDVHHRAGRPEAVADAFSRYFEEPLRGRDDDAGAAAKLLFEYGSLRSGAAKLTPREKQLLSRPEELEVLLEQRRERSTDRVVYLAGLARFRLGRWGESLRTLRWIDPRSPYYPYALYTAAQAAYALGDEKDALRSLARLVRYPEVDDHERGLETRARILRARILFESGAIGGAIGIAASIPKDDPQAGAARTWIGEALLESGEPALAVAYLGGAGNAFGASGIEARRGLVLGLAYRRLGDEPAAAAAFRRAARSLRDAP